MREEVEELGVPVMSTSRGPSHSRVGRGILGEGAEEREGPGTWEETGCGETAVVGGKSEQIVKLIFKQY